MFVQLDGVAFPVLRWAIQAGGVPTLRRWVTSGDYVLREWTAQLPCTTPASQLGILHGTVAGVPAFRWYDRELGRVLIANRPDDAAIIEQRATTGAGLLADDGLALGNLFTGDAPRAVLTMSRLGAARGSAAARETFAWFLTNPNGFTRGVVRTVAEMVKERWQADSTEPASTSCHASTGDGPTPVSAPPPTCCNAISTPRSSRRRCAREQRASTSTTSTTTRSPTMRACSAPSPWQLSTVWIRVLGTLERVSMQPPGATTSWCSLTTASPRARRSATASAPTSARYAPSSWRRKWPPSMLRSKTGAERTPSPKTSPAPGLPAEPPGAPLPPRSRHVDQGAEAANTAAVSVLGSGNLGPLYVHSSVRLTLEDLLERWPEPRARPVCTRGHRFRCRTGLCWCAVGPW